MQTSEQVYEEIFNYFKNLSSINNSASIGITHPMSNNDLNKGYLAISLVTNTLSNRYESDRPVGLEIQITLYHPKFGNNDSVLELNQKVRKALNDYLPSFGNGKVCKILHPKWIANINMWQSIYYYRLFFEEII